MAIVVTESDCEFLQNTYNPTGKVEMRVKSILVKLASGFIEFDKDVIKEIEINGSNLTKNKNKIILGALANTDFAPADENLTDDEFKEGIKYIPVLNENKKIPSKYIPATVITDIYPVSNVNNWLDVIKALEKEEIAPEKGDLIIISSSSDPEMLGSYFLKVDLSDILDEINSLPFDLSEKSKDFIDAFFIDRGEPLFVALTEPFGHLTTINVNGKSYTSENGIVDLPNTITKIIGLNSVEVIENESKDGKFEVKINVKDASETIPGVSKISNELIEVSESDIVSASVLLVKSVKENLEVLISDAKIELENSISNVAERVSLLESVKISDIPAVKKGEVLIDHIVTDHGFGRFCDAHIYVKETGEEVFTTIEKSEGMVKITSLKPDKDYAEGELILVIKP